MFSKLFKNKRNSSVIGFSIYLIHEGCYEYNEDECLILDSFQSAKQAADEIYNSSDYRIVEISLEDIVKDYGCSCGRFALETEAEQKFTNEASKEHIRYCSKPYENDESLTLIKLKN